jgi:hypothetical protein
MVFTAPDNPRLIPQAMSVLRAATQVCCPNRVTVAFHRGILPDQYTRVRASAAYITMASWARVQGFEVRDVSYDLHKIEFYDQSDFHLGYRVHAHLHFLSRRAYSVLINEDGRGEGMNQTLGLRCFYAFDQDLVPSVGEYLRRINSGEATPEFRATQLMLQRGRSEMQRFLASIAVE